MKILSIDTASNICGLSILENTNLICQLDQNTGRTHSENLMPMINQAFEQSNLTLKDIDLLVCDKGPGSFTGIRIGVATVKAFHDSLAIPCIGVTSLEALAYSVKQDGVIVSILDCKNDNCYFGLYERKNGVITELMEPQAETLETALTILSNYFADTFENPSITFIGDGSSVFQKDIKNVFSSSNFATEKENILNSYSLGLAGLNRFHFCDNISEEVLPLYLKKPQAQRQLEEKFKNIEITPMTLEDLNQIANTLTSDFDEFWNYNIIKDELNADNSNYLVAKLNQKIVGFAGIKILMDEADIMNIVVKKDSRNQGIGSLLLKELINLAKKLNLTSITLEVMEENYSAIHLYKNFGFEQIGIRKNYYKDKNGLLMTKKLT